MAQGIGLDHRCLHTPGQFSAPRGQPGEDRPGTAAVAAEVVTGATVSCERGPGMGQRRDHMPALAAPHSIKVWPEHRLRQSWCSDTAHN